jgi:roadblock/LC7 domain-containing protein
MRLVWVGALVLLITSLAALFSNPQSGRLLEVGWASAAHVLPDEKLSELQRTTPAYTSRVFALFPEPLRQRFAAKAWTAVEVMTFRSLLLWHMAPSVLILCIVGFLEGSWVRASQTTLIKMHSPMRFSVALIAQGLIPVVALLWITAPIALSGTLLVFAIGTLAILSTRNLIVHAPTQF